MIDDLISRKHRLRREALARRDAMPEDQRIEASLAVADACAAAISFEPGTVVSGFLPIRSEIDVRPLMMTFADRGVRLCVPAIVAGRLQFRELVRGAPLEPQGFGTHAPGSDAAVLDPEVMLVPFAAFDRRCQRIGYGKGFYDAAIATIRAKGIRPVLAGVGFSVQEVGDVPTAGHDEPLDFVVTEREIVRPGIGKEAAASAGRG